MIKKTIWIHATLVLMTVVLLCGAAAAGETQNTLVRESAVEEIVKRGVLRAGFSTFVPWAMKDKDGNFIGFEIDVMRRLAEDMGVELEVVPTKWAGIIPALLTGKFDVIIGGMGITPQRNLKVNFTEPYYYSGLTLMANRKLCEPFAPQTLDDFNREDVVFAERMGVTAVNFIKRRLPKAQIRLYDDPTTAYQDVINGKAHAAINDAPEPAFQIYNHPEELYDPLKGEKLTHEPVGFACRKGDPDWLNYLNNWITFQHSRPWMKERWSYWFETREWEDLIQ